MGSRKVGREGVSGGGGVAEWVLVGPVRWAWTCWKMGGRGVGWGVGDGGWVGVGL